MAGVEDCYTSACGQTATLSNFAKATYAAINKTYSYLTPDLWKETVFTTGVHRGGALGQVPPPSFDAKSEKFCLKMQIKKKK